MGVLVVRLECGKKGVTAQISSELLNIELEAWQHKPALCACSIVCRFLPTCMPASYEMIPLADEALRHARRVVAEDAKNNCNLGYIPECLAEPAKQSETTIEAEQSPPPPPPPATHME